METLLVSKADNEWRLELCEEVYGKPEHLCPTCGKAFSAKIDILVHQDEDGCLIDALIAADSAREQQP